jgi:uncharacterized membrane protein YqhA
MLERIFEGGLWNSRFFVILAVIFGLLSSIVLFIVASIDIWGMLVEVYNMLFHHIHPQNFHENVVSTIIGAVDLYLIGIVLLIFAFGIYELFISKIDPAANGENGSKVLDIHSLDQLKDKIAKVIVMVLVVNFFQRVLHTQYNGALEMLYLSGSILFLALALYFLHKGDH